MQQSQKKRKIRGIWFLFKGDSWSNIYDHLNHAVHNLAQSQTKLIMGKGIKEGTPASQSALLHSADLHSASQLSRGGFTQRGVEAGFQGGQGSQ